MDLPEHFFLNFAACEAVLLLMFARAQRRPSDLADAGHRRARGAYHV